MSERHIVKSWPMLFQPLLDGRKRHDIRDKRDREYQVGDQMLLQEWNPASSLYSGRELLMVITYITDNEHPCAMSSACLDRNFCILTLAPVEV